MWNSTPLFQTDIDLFQNTLGPEKKQGGAHGGRWGRGRPLLREHFADVPLEPTVWLSRRSSPTEGSDETGLNSATYILESLKYFTVLCFLSTFNPFRQQ